MTGSGTAEAPYMIYDVDDLQNMNLNLTAYYELANDIDATDTSTWNLGAGFEPVGAPGYWFEGSLDGNEYIISNLFINRPDDQYVGLFGYVEYYGNITNVGLVGVNITGNDHVGSLAGMNMCPVDNCYATGFVTAVGIDEYDQTLVGGLIGNHGWGGIAVGVLSNSWTACVVYSVVNATGLQIGGLVGANGGTIENCYSFSNVYGDTETGGLIGRNIGSITNCFARGSVDGYLIVGGLVGLNWYGDIYNTYSTGVVSSYLGLEGGLIGDHEGGSVNSSFWDTETSGTSNSSGGTGKTTAQMKTESTFILAGWDFESIWNIDVGTNDGYPYFGGGAAPIFPGDFAMVLWFQPNNIILGTTLPDRAIDDGEQDGYITWGSNPAGISVGLTGFYSDYTPANVTLPQEIITPPQDMVGPTGNPGHTRDVGTLVDNPFYPLIKGLSDHSGISVQLWWIILASIIVVAAMVVTYKFLPHQMIVALVGGGLSAFFYAMGIYPFWVVLIFAVMALAIILGERSPTV
jgi:hypothetical protein